MRRRIEKAVVLGAGTMGSRIAAHFANAGLPCILLDIVPPDAPRGNLPRAGETTIAPIVTAILSATTMPCIFLLGARLSEPAITLAPASRGVYPRGFRVNRHIYLYDDWKLNLRTGQAGSHWRHVIPRHQIRLQ